MIVSVFMKKLFLLLAFLICFGGFSQTNIDYLKVDNYVQGLGTKNFKSLKQLKDTLVNSFDNDYLKVRAFYIWIANNIKYDCFADNNLREQLTDTELIIRKKRTGSIGYSLLFKDLCNMAGIECEVVSGYAKNKPDQIGVSLKKVDHAWNLVRINYNWYYVDVTWGTGDQCKCILFRKDDKFNDIYFLMNADQFIFQHFPKNKKFQQLDTVINKSKFSKFPYIQEGLFSNKVLKFSPVKGIIKIKQYDTLKISISTFDNNKIEMVQIYNHKMKIYEDAFIKQTLSGYQINYPVKRAKIYNITLYINSKASLTYILNVKPRKLKLN